MSRKGASPTLPKAESEEPDWKVVMRKVLTPDAIELKELTQGVNVLLMDGAAGPSELGSSRSTDMQQLLVALGYPVVMVGSVNEGLEELHWRPGAYRLVLADVLANSGLAGLKFLQHIRSNARTAHLQVVMFSECEDERVISAALSLSAVDYLVMPAMAGRVSTLWRHECKLSLQTDISLPTPVPISRNDLFHCDNSDKLSSEARHVAKPTEYWDSSRNARDTSQAPATILVCARRVICYPSFSFLEQNPG